jgi:uncharacterized membrane protein
MESKKRSLYKTISWYLFHNVMMFTITYVFTGSWEVGVAVALLQTLGEAGLYYMHERIWTRLGVKRDGNH